MTCRSVAANQLIFVACVAGCASSSTRDTARAGAAGNAGGTGANSAGANSAGANSAGASTASDAGDAGAEDNAGAAGIGAGGELANAGSYSLFNGVDFAGWDRYLGKPSAAEPAFGIDNDPRAVYSVVSFDSEPAIRISGEVWGALISKREFCNFRLRAEFRWGTALWPPLNARDSGIMFLSTGPLGAVNAGGNALSNPIGSGGFMVAAEYQIATGDVGTLYNLGPIAFSESEHSAGQEQPDGWNRVEISLQNDTASLLLNDHEVSQASGFLLAWPDQPTVALRCGKLQLQSEGAEIFFRRLEIEELP
jgi:hypothetical protein